jgi:hypothetical protein
MRLRTATIDLVAAEFADAIASGDNDRAEGWLATALWVERRQRRSGPLARFLQWSRRRSDPDRTNRVNAQ